MSEKRVKSLRKMIYGDMSTQTKFNIDKKTGTIYADTMRQRYQIAKGRKEHMPKLGRVRIVAKRPKGLAKVGAVEGAFGTRKEFNHYSDMNLERKVSRETKHAEESKG